MAEKSDKSVKRLVKNPETFRERAIKAADEGDKPKRAARLKSAGSKVVSPVLRPIGAASGKIARQKPVRLVGKVLIPNYARTSWEQLRQVKWPDLRTSRQLTFAVLVFAVIFGVVVAIVDYGLDKLFRNVLLK